jgi:hypothetical protein
VEAKVVDVSRRLAGTQYTYWSPPASQVVAGFTIQCPPNTSTVLLNGGAAIASGTNTIILPLQAVNGDEVTITSQYAISGLVVTAGQGSTIGAGPAAPTSLGAGTGSVKYLKVGNTWNRTA